MFDWIEIGLLSTAGALMLLRALPRLRSYRPLFDAGAALSLISALYPWPSNRLGQFLFDTTGDGPRLPREFFGVVWWILGAWIAKSLLNLALERTLFPDNDQPHSRRLFADLASGLIYILAFIGIVGAVFKEPVSTLLATSGCDSTLWEVSYRFGDRGSSTHGECETQRRCAFGVSSISSWYSR